MQEPDAHDAPGPLPGRRRGAAPLDGWSWVHLGSGMALGALVAGWLVPFALLAAYEALEAVLRRLPIRRDGLAAGLVEYESWPNIVADVVVGMAGVGLVRWLWPWQPLLET